MAKAPGTFTDTSRRARKLIRQYLDRPDPRLVRAIDRYLALAERQWKEWEESRKQPLEGSSGLTRMEKVTIAIFSGILAANLAGLVLNLYRTRKGL